MNMLPNTKQLLSAINIADGQLAAAESRLALIESCLRLAEVTIARVRRLADEHGISVAKPMMTVTAGASENLSEEEFASRVGVSVRTIAADRKLLQAGVHYHLHGRRVLYHFPEARDFLREHFGRSASLERKGDIETLAIDEVTQRRARVALRRARGGR